MLPLWNRVLKQCVRFGILSRLDVREAHKRDRCQVCRQYRPRPLCGTDPLVLNYGKDYVHKSCLDVVKQ